MFTIPKGHRSMTRKAADLLDVKDVPGVHAVVEDPNGDVTYVKCSPSAWAKIQYMAAQRLGVQHTGRVGNEARAKIWSVCPHCECSNCLGALDNGESCPARDDARLEDEEEDEVQYIRRPRICPQCGGHVSAPRTLSSGTRCTDGIHLGRPAIHD